MNLYTYSAELKEVIDGDTYDFTVDLGLHVSKDIRVRMSGIDTHETYGVDHNSEEYEKGIKEKKWVEDWFDSSDELYIETEKDEQGKYGRWLAKVYNESGESLNVAIAEEFDNVKA